MKEPPNRTKHTNLTDDELLLFDLLLDRRCSLAALNAKEYSIHLNVPYTHSISDSELAKVLMDLKVRGLLHCKRIIRDGIEKPTFTLSDRGREHWENERNPDWRSFVVSRGREWEQHLCGSTTIYCIDESIGKRFGAALFASGLATPVSGMRVKKLESLRLIPSKHFDGVSMIRFKSNDRLTSIPRQIDWQVYHDSRCWWNCINELQHYPQKPEHPTMHAKI